MQLVFACLMMLVIGGLVSQCGSSSSDRPEVPPLQDPYLRDPSPSGAARIVGNHFILAPEISAEQQRYLAQDLNIVQTFNASLSSSENAAFRRTLGVANLDGATLYDWMKERLQYLIGQQLSSYKFSLVYPNEQSYGYFKIGDRDDAIGESLTGAVNVGAGLFSFTHELTQFESRQQYMRMEIDGKWVDVTTPRVGIMQIGPALFGVSVSPQRPTAFANSALRIETLFHEARHSDGNKAGSSLGFTHIECPGERGVAPELIGKSACDNSTNGAYTVGALILRSYYKNCGPRCTDRELEILKAYYLDNISRVIVPEEGPAARLDPSPELGVKAVDISNFKLTTIQ